MPTARQGDSLASWLLPVPASCRQGQEPSARGDTCLVRLFKLQKGDDGPLGSDYPQNEHETTRFYRTHRHLGTSGMRT